MSTYIRNSTGFLYQILGETSARRAQNSGSLHSFFFRAREVRTKPPKPPIPTRSNSSMEMMCHGVHARNHWHVALLTTEFAGTFIDLFRNTTSAQSSREPKSTARATQQSAVVKIEGVRSQFINGRWITFAITPLWPTHLQWTPMHQTLTWCTSVEGERRGHQNPQAPTYKTPQENRVRTRTHKRHTIRRQQQLPTCFPKPHSNYHLVTAIVVSMSIRPPSVAATAIVAPPATLILSHVTPSPACALGPMSEKS